MERSRHQVPFFGRITTLVNGAGLVALVGLRRPAGALMSLLTAFGNGFGARFATDIGTDCGAFDRSSGTTRLSAPAPSALCRYKVPPSAASTLVSWSRLTAPGFASISAMRACLTPTKAPSWPCVSPRLFRNARVFVG